MNLAYVSRLCISPVSRLPPINWLDDPGAVTSQLAGYACMALLDEDVLNVTAGQQPRLLSHGMDGGRPAATAIEPRHGWRQASSYGIDGGYLTAWPATRQQLCRDAGELHAYCL